MAPIYAEVVQRAIAAVSREKTEGPRQELREGPLVHRAGGRRKFGMVNGAEPAGMALNLDVVRRVGEDRRGAVLTHQQLRRTLFNGAAAVDAVRPQFPEIR